MADKDEKTEETPSGFQDLLQMLLIGVVMLGFFGGWFVGGLLCLLLCHMGLWPLVLAYLAWAFLLDRHIPSNYGRRFSFLRSNPAWHLVRSYFPVRMITPGKLDSNRNHILCYHPHGVMGVGATSCFASEAVDVTKRLGVQVYPTTMGYVFCFPFVRDFFLGLGICSVSRQSLLRICSKGDGGNAALVAVGGAEEAFDAKPGHSTVKLNGRKGFVKIALETGSSLVPTYCFGENEVYDQIPNPPGSLVRTIQEMIKKVTGVAPVFFYGRYVFLPRRIPLTVVVGEALDVPKIENPSHEDIEAFHKLYIERLKQLFDKYKERYNTIDPNAILTIR